MSIPTVTLAATTLCVTVAAATADQPVPLVQECEPQWESAIGQSGMSSQVHAVLSHNGDVYAGGSFSMAGGRTVNRIARWDGHTGTWHLLESGGQVGVNAVVNALAEYNGDLIVAGAFATAGGMTVNRIAGWSAASGEWYALASGGQTGVSGEVKALAVYNGDLYAGGLFSSAGGHTVNGIARWDGSAWHPLVADGWVGVDGIEPYVHTLAVYDGNLIAGGQFTHAGGTTVNHIARWNGVAWHPLASGGQTGADDIVSALETYDGDLFAGGWFSSVGGMTVNHIARWDGSAWHQVFSGGQIGANGWVLTLAEFDGDLIAGGAFTSAGGQTVNRVARWDGDFAIWHPLASGGSSGVDGNWVLALTPHDTHLVVGGSFNAAGGEPAAHIALWGCTELPDCPWDFNGDGVVDGADLGQLLANWGVCSDCGDCPWDVTGDCTVDGADLGQLLANWGECP